MAITLKDGRIIRMIDPKKSDNPRSLYQRGAKQDASTGEIVWPPPVRKERKKKCRFCSKLLPYTAYSRDSKSRDGLKSYCRECAREYNREYRDRVRGGPPKHGYRERPLQPYKPVYRPRKK